MNLYIKNPDAHSPFPNAEVVFDVSHYRMVLMEYWDSMLDPGWNMKKFLQ